MNLKLVFAQLLSTTTNLLSGLSSTERERVAQITERAGEDIYNLAPLAALAMGRVNSFGTVNPAETIQSLTDGATITPDISLGQVCRITLGGNRTIAAPTNLLPGQLVIFEIVQDVTGTRIPTWNAAYVFTNNTPPVLTTTATKRDFVFFIASGGNLHHLGQSLNHV